MIKLKAVGDKIRAVIIKHIDFVIDKIAIHSKAYKQLQNRYNRDLKELQGVKSISNFMKNSQMPLVIQQIYNTYSMNSLLEYDAAAIRLSEPTDIIVVDSITEKNKILEEFKQGAGSGQIYTIEEFIHHDFTGAPINKMYVKSTVWMKDWTLLVNLLYKYEMNNERYTL